jgi:hypothetical protein
MVIAPVSSVNTSRSRSISSAQEMCAGADVQKRADWPDEFALKVLAAAINTMCLSELLRRVNILILNWCCVPHARDGESAYAALRWNNGWIIRFPRGSSSTPRHWLGKSFEVLSGLPARITLSSDPDPHAILFLFRHEYPVRHLGHRASAAATDFIEGGGADGNTGRVGTGRILHDNRGLKATS